MKLETFFEKFDQFADAPDAVAKMRALLIQLAVQGKLVPNDSSESPVNLKLSGGFEGTAPLPTNWRSGLLGEVLSFEYGDNLPAPKRSESGEYPVYGSNGIVGTHNTYLTRDPAIIIGRKGSAGALNISAGPSWTTDVAYFVRPPKEIDLRYTYYLLASLRLDELGKGIKPGLSRKEAYALPVAFPPLAEQERIVAKVDELMVLCDRLEAQQKERETRHAALTRAAIARFDEVPTPVNLNFLFHNSYSITPTDLRKTILNLAVQGKLVSERHGTVDPRSTFESLMTIKRRAIEETSLPRSWVLASYRNLTSLVTSGSRGWKEFYSDSGSIFVRTQNIKTDRLLLDDIAYVNLPDSVEGLRAQIKKNDILITITGANVTKTARVEDDIPKAYVSQHIALTRPRWPDMSAWLHLCFIAPGAARGKLEALAYGDKPGLNLNNIRDLVIPIPPLSQQRQIIAEVDRLMKMVDRMEILLSESKIQTKHLLDAVVYELLHPIADVIEFPSSETDCASQRAAIGCYAIEHLVRNPSFGRVMLMKACYLSETHLGLPLGWQPMRQAAGPWDPWIEDFESMGKGNDWFTVTEKILYNSHSKIEYSAKKGLKAKAVEAITVLGDQKAEFDRLLNLFVDKNTEEAEIIATLFAAWNDFLIDGKTPTDDEIIREVRENWHPSKERFTPARLNRWIGWMRSHHLTPKGHGPRTRQQLTLALS